MVKACFSLNWAGAGEEGILSNILPMVEADRKIVPNQHKEIERWNLNI